MASIKYSPTYQSAKIVAPKISEHFLHHIALAHDQEPQDIATIPKVNIIEAIIDVCFWASFRSEEGKYPRISLAFLSPEQALHPVVFQEKLTLNAYVLSKLAPGIEGAGIHLGVWFQDGELFVWGSTTYIPDYCFVLDVSEPGLLVIKHKRINGYGKFTNVVILKGDEIKIVNEESGILPDSPQILKSLLGFTAPYLRNDTTNILIQLAVFMRSHGRGGTLLLTPSDDEQWKQSLISPFRYQLNPPFEGLANLILKDGSNISESLWISKLKKEVDHIAGFTAIDGATIMNDKYELLAFGVKIGKREGNSSVKKVAFIEPVIGGEASLIDIAQLGGTRHLSSAQFVYDNHDCIALVASQDGHFTVLSWSITMKCVQAHRIETLLF
ncbi:putative sensor domain DACNV-containing protein [Pedobacter glucosidilyticus]|uniref:putative sensor domain DACNV-containing protein n=1 Tax=Pedobacter glucosidilyticus TaxID=1122941 RepID=UPI000417CC28